MNFPPIILKLKRVTSDELIEINICYKVDFDKFNIKFYDPEYNTSNVEFSFDLKSEVLQYLETFINLVSMCHEEEIVSLECVIPGYPIVRFKMSESKSKFPILSKSVMCYLTAFES
jgi:hypothetical protein